MDQHEAWGALYDDLMVDAPSASTRRCPNCGAGSSLRLICTVTGLDAGTGLAALWCAECLEGMAPNFPLIPDGAERVLRGTERVPNYRCWGWH
ncbi:hypothetical protein ABZW10_21290 [Kitasatospora sp. NPDC004723]|uniref:hypothetical protein n=1 Tax=Kitasatospora sp. NPDC004723 TaxID=3154288 RepID=UPI0033B85BFF